jgi:hypothetical protein
MVTYVLYSPPARKGTQVIKYIVSGDEYVRAHYENRWRKLQNEELHS